MPQFDLSTFPTILGPLLMIDLGAFWGIIFEHFGGSFLNLPGFLFFQKSETESGLEFLFFQDFVDLGSIWGPR